MNETIRPENKKVWPKIYVKVDKRPKTVRELLYLLFEKIAYNGGKTWAAYLGGNTYSNKECTKLQCTKGRYRSFDDIYACCRTYFPNVTPKKVMHELLLLDLKTSNDVVLIPKLRICSTIRLIRISYETGVVEISDSKLDSQWSWLELLSMLDIKPNGLSWSRAVQNYITANKK